MKVVVIGGGWSGCAVHLKRHQKNTQKSVFFYFKFIFNPSAPSQTIQSIIFCIYICLSVIFNLSHLDNIKIILS